MWQRSKNLVMLTLAIICNDARSSFEHSPRSFLSPFHLNHSGNGPQPYKVPHADLTCKFLQVIPFKRSLYCPIGILSKYSKGRYCVLVLMFSMQDRLKGKFLQIQCMAIVRIMIDSKLAPHMFILCSLSRSLG